ncbi:SP0191 family lipoprotein [Streptococcus sp. 20-1249]|uniref:SP0191 family lipoprotein n=1 Tax=Streptococcus hepaticus TaxID=3349163 RepID=UPI0037481F1C
MKKTFYLLALASLMVLGACSRQTAKDTTTSSSEATALPKGAITSKHEMETKRKFEYIVEMNDLQQIQWYEVTYKGEKLLHLTITLAQTLPEEVRSAITDDNREELLQSLRDTPGVKEAGEVKGMTVSTSLNEENQSVLVFDADMLQLDYQAAANLATFGQMFAGLKDMEASNFLAGLNALGAKEIK